MLFHAGITVVILPQQRSPAPGSYLAWVCSLVCDAESETNCVTPEQSNTFKFFLNLPTEHKVIIVGLDNAGKTTILYQL